MCKEREREKDGGRLKESLFNILYCVFSPVRSTFILCKFNSRLDFLFFLVLILCLTALVNTDALFVMPIKHFDLN